MAMRSFGAGSAGPRLIPSGIRPHLLAPRIISQRRSRISRALPRRSFETRAERRRPGDGGNFNFGGGGGNGGTQALDYALPAAGALALLAFGTPLLGGLASSLGVVLLITAGAGALGVIDRISAAFGVSPLTAAGGASVLCLKNDL